MFDTDETDEERVNRLNEAADKVCQLALSLSRDPSEPLVISGIALSSLMITARLSGMPIEMQHSIIEAFMKDVEEGVRTYSNPENVN